MTPDIEISPVDRSISVAGCLDVATVAEYRKAGEEMMNELDSVTLDLSGSMIIGSAAIALLIAWQRDALRQDKPFKIVNSPANLLAIAEACGVEDILPFE